MLTSKLKELQNMFQNSKTTAQCYLEYDESSKSHEFVPNINLATFMDTNIQRQKAKTK